MFRGKKVVVVMPAFNAAGTLRQTHAEVREQRLLDLIILVDNRSRDDTVAVRLRAETAVTVQSIAERLQMGTPGYVNHLLCRWRKAEGE